MPSYAFPAGFTEGVRRALDLRLITEADLDANPTSPAASWNDSFYASVAGIACRHLR
jgi:hypothetical protein